MTTQKELHQMEEERKHQTLLSRLDQISEQIQHIVDRRASWETQIALEQLEMLLDWSTRFDIRFIRDSYGVYWMQGATPDFTILEIEWFDLAEGKSPADCLANAWNMRDELEREGGMGNPNNRETE